MSDLKETKLEQLLLEQSKVEVTPMLREKVEALARHYPPSAIHTKSSSRHIRFGLLLGAGAIALAGIIFLSPSSASALAHMSHAIEGARSLHFKMVDLGKGKPNSSYEEWYQKGTWRMDRADGDISIWKNGIALSYLPSAHRVLRKLAPTGPFKGGQSDFEMSDILRGAITGGRGQKALVTNKTERSYQVQVDNPYVKERYHFLVDSKTDLPETMTVEVPVKGKWTLKMKGRLEFNLPISASLFSPSFKGVEVVDETEFAKSTKAILNHIIATLSLGKEAITIHDIHANRLGQIFMLYTGHFRQGEQWLEMKDIHGNRYLNCDLVNQSSFFDQEVRSLSGSGLKVLWWIPVADRSRDWPVNPVLRSEHQAHLPIPGNPRAFTMGRLEQVASKMLTIDAPTVSDVPNYLTTDPTLMMPKNETELREVAAMQRSRYYQSIWIDQAGKRLPNSVGLTWYVGKSSGYRRDPSALKLALTFGLQELEIARRAGDSDGLPVSVGKSYLDLYQISYLLGRPKQGELYLREAVRCEPDLANDARKWFDYERQAGNIPNHLVPTH